MSSPPVPNSQVAAVVLNWNHREETLTCLSSLAASDWPALTTIVVDNGSEQDVWAAVSERFAGALQVQNPQNLGFAGGMNAGIRRALEAGADHVLLLNNDTVVDPAMVRHLVGAAEAHADAGIVSPLVLRRDAPNVIHSAGLNLDLRRCYQGGPIGAGESDQGQFAGVREVDAVSGAAMLASAEAIRTAGMLDESLFLYIEDVEWALRMREGGLRSYVCGEARLWHGSSVSSGGAHSPEVRYYHTRNTFVVSERYLPMRGLRRAMRRLDIVFMNMVSALRGRRRLAGARAVLAGWRDFRRGRLGPAPGG